MLGFAVILTSLLWCGEHRPVLLVGIDPTFPPFACLKAEGGCQGLDVELATALAKRMHCRLQLAQVPFRDLLDSLQAGEVQALISGMGIRPDRDNWLPLVGLTLTPLKSRWRLQPRTRQSHRKNWLHCD
jgi:ABC-type amino acid transport substrate-binding protein